MQFGLGSMTITLRNVNKKITEVFFENNVLIGLSHMPSH